MPTGEKSHEVFWKKAQKIVGQRFGRLVVEEILPSRPGKGSFRVRCRCDCGNTKITVKHYVTGGKTKSCGCARRLAGLASTEEMHKDKDRRSLDPLYPRWSSMINRCTSPLNPAWPNYGGRGIKVCEEWVEDFWAYHRYIHESLGPPPSPECSTIDRIDNDGDYRPGNLRWASDAQQCGNTRVSIRVEIDGRVRGIAEWARHFGMKPDTARYRWRKGIRGLALFAPPTKSTKRLDPEELLRIMRERQGR